MVNKTDYREVTVCQNDSMHCRPSDRSCWWCYKWCTVVQHNIYLHCADI